MNVVRMIFLLNTNIGKIGGKLLRLNFLVVLNLYSSSKVLFNFAMTSKRILNRSEQILNWQNVSAKKTILAFEKFYFAIKLGGRKEKTKSKTVQRIDHRQNKVTLIEAA